MRHTTYRLFVSLVALSFTGCHSIHSISPTPGEGFSDAASRRLALQYNLPRADIRLQGNYQPVLAADGITVARYEFKVSISAKRRADINAPILATLSTNAMFDEDSHLKVDGSLLQTASTKPEDKTGEVIIALAKTAIAAAKVMANLPAATPQGEGAPSKAPAAVVQDFDVTIDPADLKSFEDAKATLAKSGFVLDIPDIDPIRTELGKKKATPASADGLIYRMRLPVFVSLTKAPGFSYKDKTENTEAKFESTLVIPHPGMLGVMPFKRVFMAKRETTVVFVDGDPVEITLNQGSPVLNFVGVPLKIAEAAAEAIPGIIQVHNKAPTDRVSAQANYLDAQARLLESQKKLQDAQKTEQP